MILSRVAFGICLAEGALFSTAETVPGDSPTCAATDFRVTVFPFDSAVFLLCAILLRAANPTPIHQRRLPQPFRASHYMALLSSRNVIPHGGVLPQHARFS